MLDIEKLSTVLSTRVRPRQLLIFMAIYECRNIVAAAKRVSLNQSTLSKGLTAMEETLEQKLFIRLPRGVKPTPIGDVLYRHCKLLMAQNKQVAKEILRLTSPEAGQIVIGCSSVWDSFIARAISKFKALYPKNLVRIRIESEDDLINRLQRAEVDLIFSRLFPEWQLPSIIQEPLFNDPNAIVVASNHPELGKPHPCLENLLDYPWVMPLPNAMIRRSWDQMFLSRGVPFPENVIECSSVLTVRSLLLEIENVITMPPASAFRDELEEGLFHQLDLRLLETNIPVGLSYREESRNSSAILAFKHAIHRLVQTNKF